MQCKDIPNKPILGLLLDGEIYFLFKDVPHSVVPAFPEDTPPKLVKAKMGSLIRNGLVNGCACGCRGDFTITELGKAQLLYDNKETT